MESFIVLGLVPGTDIQITFLLWIILTLVLFVAASIWLLRRARIIRKWLITGFLVITLHQRRRQSHIADIAL
jgi:hypothetical protein